MIARRAVVTAHTQGSTLESIKRIADHVLTQAAAGRHEMTVSVKKQLGHAVCVSCDGSMDTFEKVRGDRSRITNLPPERGVLRSFATGRQTAAIPVRQ